MQDVSGRYVCVCVYIYPRSFIDSIFFIKLEVNNSLEKKKVVNVQIEVIVRTVVSVSFI